MENDKNKLRNFFLLNDVKSALVNFSGPWENTLTLWQPL